MTAQPNPLYPQDDGMAAVERMTAEDAEALVIEVQRRLSAATREPSWCETQHVSTGDVRHYLDVRHLPGTGLDGLPVKIDVAIVAEPGEFPRFEFVIGGIVCQVSVTDTSLLAASIEDVARLLDN